MTVTTVEESEETEWTIANYSIIIAKYSMLDTYLLVEIFSIHKHWHSFSQTLNFKNTKHFYISKLASNLICAYQIHRASAGKYQQGGI